MENTAQDSRKGAKEAAKNEFREIAFKSEGRAQIAFNEAVQILNQSLPSMGRAYVKLMGRVLRLPVWFPIPAQ